MHRVHHLMGQKLSHSCPGRPHEVLLLIATGSETEIAKFNLEVVQYCKVIHRILNDQKYTGQRFSIFQFKRGISTTLPSSIVTAFQASP